MSQTLYASCVVAVFAIGVSAVAFRFDHAELTEVEYLIEHWRVIVLHLLLATPPVLALTVMDQRGK